MSAGNPTKVLSIRANEEIQNKFRELTAELGGNQEQTMMRLIQTWEMQTSKSFISDRAAEIEQFDSWLSMIENAYVQSLTDNQILSETIHMQYKAQLESKDKIIAELQEKAEYMGNNATCAQERADELEQKVANMEDILEKERISAYEKSSSQNKMIDDKEKLIASMQKIQQSLQTEVDAMETACKEANETKKELLATKNKLSVSEETNLKLQSEISMLQKQIEENKADNARHIKEAGEHEKNMLEMQRTQMEVTHAQEIMATKEEFQKQINDLREEMRKQVDQYQQKYMDLLEKMGIQK